MIALVAFDDIRLGLGITPRVKAFHCNNMVYTILITSLVISNFNLFSCIWGSFQYLLHYKASMLFASCGPVEQLIFIFILA